MLEVSVLATCGKVLDMIAWTESTCFKATSTYILMTEACWSLPLLLL